MRRSPAVRWTTGYFLLFVCLGLDIAILGPTLSSLAGQTGAGLSQMGLLFLLGSAGGVLGTALSGPVFDRWNGHAVLGGAQLLAAALIALVPAAPAFWVLAALMAVKGVAQGLVNTGANILLTWTHRERSGPYMNALHFFFGLGAVLAPFLVARLTGIPAGYRLAYWGLSAFAGLVGLSVLAQRACPQPRHDRAMAARAPGPSPWPLVTLAALFLFFYVGAEISFGGWVYTYARRLGLASEAGAAYLSSAFWLAFTGGRLASIPVSTRAAPQRVLLAAATGCLLAILAVLLRAGSAGVLWGATLLLGFCMGPIWPTGFTLASRSVALTGRMSAVVILGDAFGCMVLPSALGKVIESTGPRSMIFLIGTSLVLNLLALGGMLWVRARRR
ncbi:MAG TPA: MFS transporter [Anaeromyxobacter sp.]|nr:MFS transporter [Anaeromyxobacter sp.]